MLTQEDNELLCRVGPDTPMGELWRRFWVPAVLSYEVPEPDCTPVRFRLLGEDLIAFRDSSGRIGVVQNACPHRGASMFFGRNEEDGLRCVYHGWKFDVTGNCVDMPNEPAESNFKHKIRIGAYPAQEWGDVIWVYMGPSDLKPELPQLEWATVPSSHRHVSKWHYSANFLQGLEGELDSAHISFLHSWLDNDTNVAMGRPRGNLSTRDRAPRLSLKATDYGLIYGGRRETGDGNYYWRLTPYMMPVYTIIPGPRWPLNCRIYIPRDDDHTMGINAMYNPERPLTDEEIARMDSGVANVPRLIAGTFEPIASRDNDYFIDREFQRTRNYTGIPNLNEQDKAIVESMGPIYDRTHEHLGTTDMAIIAMRRMFLRMLKQMEQGIPPAAAYNGALYRVRPLDVVSEHFEYGDLLTAFADNLVAAK